MAGVNWIGGASAVMCILSGGCAIVPFQAENHTQSITNAERDMLARAAHAVETTPWPKVEQVSFISRMTGGKGEEGVTRSEAVDIYVAKLSGERAFGAMLEDAEANLTDARSLHAAANRAVNSSRLSVNDIVIVETAMQTLAENRRIYAAAARALENRGAAPVDKSAVNAMEAAYRDVIKSLGVTADLLAEKIEQDRSRAYAEPEDKTINYNFAAGI